MRHRSKLALGLATAAVAASLALTGCSSPTPSGAETTPAGDETPDFTPITSIKVQLQWLPQAQFAGYYAAQEQGYFKEEGFDDVELVPSGGDIVPQDALANGDVDFAVAWVPKVLGSLEGGEELTDILQVYKESGTYQISFKGSGVASVDDFEGKKIGTWGFGNEWEIFAAMAAKGLDSTTVDVVTQDFTMNQLLNHEIDAAEAMSYNEYAMLLETVNPATGKLYTPDDFDIVKYQDTDGAMLQDALWADTEKLDDPAYADAAVRLIKALTKGWLYARDNVEDAAKISFDAATAAGNATGATHQLWQLNEVNKLIWDGTPFGEIDKSAWDKTVAGALAAKNQDGLNLITTEPADTAYSNTYVDQALSELEADGDVTAADLSGAYTPIDVTLTEGGK